MPHDLPHDTTVRFESAAENLPGVGNHATFSPSLGPLPSDSTSVMNIGVLEDERESTFLLDETRLFYHPNGAFKHDWSLYRIYMNDQCVEVFWSDGLCQELTGRSAVQFLRITKSRFVREFAELAGVTLSDGRRPTGMRSSD